MSSREDVPEDAPEACPGTQSESAGKEAACAGCPNQKICASGLPRGPDPDVDVIKGKRIDLRQYQAKQTNHCSNSFDFIFRHYLSCSPSPDRKAKRRASQNPHPFGKGRRWKKHGDGSSGQMHRGEVRGTKRRTA